MSRIILAKRLGTSRQNQVEIRDRCPILSRQHASECISVDKPTDPKGRQEKWQGFGRAAMVGSCIDIQRQTPPLSCIAASQGTAQKDATGSELETTLCRSCYWGVWMGVRKEYTKALLHLGTKAAVQLTAQHCRRAACMRTRRFPLDCSRTSA